MAADIISDTGGMIMAIGYACLTVEVPGTGLVRCILKNAAEEKLRSLILSNLTALDRMIDYNIQNNIKLFRISSDIIPFGSHPVNQVRWWVDYQELLMLLGQKIRNAGIRVSMHPGQYTILNSPDGKVVQNAIQDLEYHDQFLTSIGAEQNGKLVLHIGGVYGDKKKAMSEFQRNYQLLSENIKKRLVIENDDRNYNIEDILQLSAVTGAPAVFDNLHHRINPPAERLEDSGWILRCRETWSKLDGVQKIHYSQQKEGGKRGSHSDTILLSEFLSYYHTLPQVKPDIMLEVKDKNLSAVKCIHAIETGSVRG
jgi:UV DNA damage endonuclease